MDLIRLLVAHGASLSAPDNTGATAKDLANDNDFYECVDLIKELEGAPFCVSVSTCVCVCVRVCVRACVCTSVCLFSFPSRTTVGVNKKVPRSTRATGARFKKMGGERETNGN